jgi:hypothetical protein
MCGITVWALPCKIVWPCKSAIYFFFFVFHVWLLWHVKSFRPEYLGPCTGYCPLLWFCYLDLHTNAVKSILVILFILSLCVWSVALQAHKLLQFFLSHILPLLICKLFQSALWFLFKYDSVSDPEGWHGALLWQLLFRVSRTQQVVQSRITDRQHLSVVADGPIWPWWYHNVKGTTPPAVPLR